MPVFSRRSLVTSLFFLVCALGFRISAFAQLPEGFYDVPVAENLDYPLGVTFDELGRMYVWEKNGKVWFYGTDGQRRPEPFLDISEEVADFREHGLNYFSLDQEFLTNGRVYLLYAVDRHYHERFGQPDYDPTYSILDDATFGRVTRYTVPTPQAADPQVDYGSRKILLGDDYDNGIPILMISHGLGSLLQSSDGTLLVSCGDSASFLGTDTGGDTLEVWHRTAMELGILTPDQDIGAYRSQYRHSFCGKVLRLDPETGDGVPSNPFYDAAAPRSPASRTWVTGLRNPYRMALQPFSGGHDPAEGDPGTLVIGNVGYSSWEELNVADRGGLNFGWPLFEGHADNWGFTVGPRIPNPAAPNPLYGTPGCDEPYFSFHDLISRPGPTESRYRYNPCDPDRIVTPAEGFEDATYPAIFWNNRNWNPPTRAGLVWFRENGDPTTISLQDERAYIEGEDFTGEASLGGVFYTGDHWPEEYRDTYYHVDYAGWIKRFDFDSQGTLYRVRPFADNLRRIVHLTMNPTDGNLYYVSLEENSVRQIGFGGNPPPRAVIESDKQYGGPTLTVRFDAGESYDPNGTDLTFHWDFGDGQTSTEVAPEHTFRASGAGPESFTVVLTATDADGATDRTERIISLNNTPPEVRIVSFRDGDRYPTDRTTLLDLRAEVSDAEHRDHELEYEWQVFFHHNTHYHPDPILTDPATYTLISPAGCGQETYWYRIRLRVTDAAGLRTEVSQNIYPHCGPQRTDWVDLQLTESGGALEATWQTSLSETPDYLELQFAPDFYHFRALDRQGPNAEQAYRYRHERPLIGTAYYRVKAHFADGSFTYSNLVPVQFPRGSRHRVSPNPAGPYTRIVIDEALTDKVRIQLFDTSGKQVYRTDWGVTPGSAADRRLELSGLPAGIYVYRLENGEETYTGQLTVSGN
jgi:glucose/arabinose dehydrogenase